MTEMQPRSPTVSVIIPTYNRAHLVGRAIRSVLAQTFQDFELIVVDDGSKDNMEEVVLEFGDPRIIFLRHETNRGGSAARNTGIRAARAEYIAFLDSDDEWLPEKTAKQLAYLRARPDKSIGVVLAGIRIVKNGEVIRESGRVSPAVGWGFEDVLHVRQGPPTCSTMLLRRASFKDVPLFDETFPSCQDWDYLLQAGSSCRLGSLGEALVVWHGDGGDHVWYGNPENALRGRLCILEKYGAQLKQSPRRYSAFHRTVADLYRQVGNVRGVRRHVLRAIQAYPWNTTHYTWLILSLMGLPALGWALQASNSARWLETRKR